MIAAPDVLVLADDLSGAAEVAAAFLGRNPAPALLLTPDNAGRRGVTVVDLDSRTMPAPQADSTLRAALDLGGRDRIVMVKIDSLLRGHLGAVVEALADRGPVIIAAGLPVLGRTVRGGVLHVDDVPLHRTDTWHLEAAAPPASIADLIGRPSRNCSTAADVAAALTSRAVAICDVTTDADLDAVVDAARVAGAQLVGTAALAAALARILPVAEVVPAESHVTAATSASTLTVVGTGVRSVAEQVAALVDRGATPVVVDAAALVAGTADPIEFIAALSSGTDVVLTVGGSVATAQRSSLATALGRHVADADIRAGTRPDLVLTGGETARAVIDAIGLDALRPVGVVHHGAVVNVAPDGRRIVTRPGSFGDRDSFVDIAAHLASTRARELHPSTTRRAPS